MKFTLLGIFVLVVATNAGPTSPYVEMTGPALDDFRQVFRDALGDIIFKMFNLSTPMVAQLGQHAAQCKGKIRAEADSCSTCIQASCNRVPESVLPILEETKAQHDEKRLVGTMLGLTGPILLKAVLSGKRSVENTPQLNLMEEAQQRNDEKRIFMTLGVTASSILFNHLMRNGKRSLENTQEVENMKERLWPLIAIQGASAAASLGFTLLNNWHHFGKRSVRDERFVNFLQRLGASRVGEPWKRTQDSSECFSSCPMCSPFTDRNHLIETVCGSDILLEYVTLYRPMKLLSTLDEINADQAAPILQKVAYNPDAGNASPVLVWARFPSGIMEYESAVPFQDPDLAAKLALEYFYRISEEQEQE